ncbi:hypothetical protein FACS1894178_1230 [Bacteroidia bacterium]|nr:hypothetical protein FACS1894178_1230 [Bacteroidia bacterium]
MMSANRTKRSFTSEFKAKVALEALTERSTVSELCSKYQLHPNVISNWKKELQVNSKQVFGVDKDSKTVFAAQEQLYVYLNPVNKLSELYAGLLKYINFYNNDRPHQSINNLSPKQYYEHKQAA